MKAKKIIKWVLIIILSIVGVLVGLLIIGFIGIAVLVDIWSPPPDPYGHLFDSQDLPPRAVDGTWLEAITAKRDTTLSGVEKLAERNVIVRVKVLDNGREIIKPFRSEYYMEHEFSKYQAEILEIYVNTPERFTRHIREDKKTIEFAQIKRIVGQSRERVFTDDEDFVPDGILFPSVRVPIEKGDELVLFFGSPPRILDPFNGAYRYCPEKSTEENRAFVSVNEYNDLILTEADLIRIRELNE
ncbi:MAG: hypothetical protein FWD19_00840 [Defluviitaleaceae bacterium]|nr:hypothetical protein [Defluviitaleaceae bacterium]